MHNDRNENGYRFEYSVDELPSVALANAIATIVGEDPGNLPPVGEVLPADALDKLVEQGNDAVVTFSYETFRITVRGDGLIVIRD